MQYIGSQLLLLVFPSTPAKASDTLSHLKSFTSNSVMTSSRSPASSHSLTSQAAVSGVQLHLLDAGAEWPTLETSALAHLFRTSLTHSEPETYSESSTHTATRTVCIRGPGADSSGGDYVQGYKTAVDSLYAFLPIWRRWHPPSAIPWQLLLSSLLEETVPGINALYVHAPPFYFL